jgi:superfamily II DNA or RNA helicase
MSDWQGIPIEITRNPGEFKLGKAPTGIGWMSRMRASQGIIKGLDGNGLFPTKAWIGKNKESKTVFVVHQSHEDGAHDENKLVLGFDDPVTAADTIMAHYPKGKHPIDSIHQIPEGGLDDWIAGNEAWAATAHDHHGRPHEHGKTVVLFNGERLPAEPADLDLPEEVAKAHEPQQPGDRWVTMHPNGPGTKGSPVLLRPVAGHPGLHRVVGGAGGKLNFLRVNLTKSPDQYKQESLERRKQTQAEEKAKLAAMSPEQLEAHQQKEAQLKEHRKRAEQEFIKKVLGDDSQEGEAPDLFSNTPDADPKAARAYHRERLKQALAACKEAERKITLDAETRVAAGLAEVGGSATPGLAINAILTTKENRGPGYDRAIAERAVANGLTAEKLTAASAAWREAQGLAPKADPTQPGAPRDEASAAAAVEMHTATKELRARQAEATAKAVEEALSDHKNLGALLRARQELRGAYEEATAARTGRVFEQGFLSTTSEPTPEDKERLVADLSEQLLRAHVQTFLDEVETNHPDNEGINGAWDPREEEGMAASRGGAAWTALHEAGLAIFGAGLLDRDTVETLGPEAAAQVLARGIRSRFSPEDQKEILTALENHHVQEQQVELPQATQEAQRLRAEAQTMKDQLLTTPKDFAAAAEMHRTRIEALKQARTTLGAALGRFEARAALVAALQSTPAKDLQVPMGRTTPERAMQAAAAMGLQPDGYTLDHKGGEAVLTIPEASQDKLLKPVDHAAVAERELAMSIKRGDMDEAGYLPPGFASRTASRYDNPLMEPKVFQRRVELPEGADHEHLEPALARYIGQRWADGHRATDINADIRGASIRDEIPAHLHGALDKIVDKLVPTHELVRDDSGEPVAEMHNGQILRDTAGGVVYKTKMREPKQIAADVEAMGRRFLDASGDAETLEGQGVDSDHPDFREAIHRTLAEDPRLQAAHAPIGELTAIQRQSIRDWFYREHHGKKGAELADALQALGPEPPKFDETTGGMSLFDDLGPMESQAWNDWQEKHKAIIEKHGDTPGTSPWATYIQAMGGLKQATEAIQGEMQSKLAEGFHGHYGRLTGKVLQLGTGDIAHFSSHLKATSGAEKAAELEAIRRSKQAQMQRGGAGRFRSVNVRERMEQAGEAGLFGQGGALFGSEELSGAAPAEETPKWEKPEPAPGERLRLGGRIEAQIAAAMPHASAPFQSRTLKPVKVAEGMSMDGRFAPQQRGVKAFNHLRRMGLFYGAGSGKTAVLMGSASSLVHSGKGKKILMAVPSIVQEQFAGEAANFLDPTTGIRLHAVPGESFEQRLQAYRDPERHAVVMTHAAVRDDSVKLLASHRGISEDAAAEWAMKASAEDLKTNLREAFAKEGANFDALMVDEGHDALNRKGKPDSLLAKIIDAHGHNASHYIGATGSPVKNDPSEAHDWLHKIDPVRYPREGRDEFLRRYGTDSAVSRRALKAELSRYFFAERVGSGVTAHHNDETIQLTAEQHADVERIERAAGKLRLGEDPVRWAKELAPRSFIGKPEEEHAAIAEGVKKAVGTFREAAMDRAINIGGGKMHAAVKKAREAVAEGRPMIIFAHRLEAVEALHKAMEEAGLRVASITGKDSSKDKPGKLAAFQGAPGRQATADVLIASDAAATGANLQRAKELIHFDQPMTYKTHEQRTARMDRLGQTEDVNVTNLLADHAYDRTARERVKRKQTLADIYQSKEGYLDDSGIAHTLRALRARAAQTKEEAA